MANQLNSRLTVIDTNATTLSGLSFIRLIQWVDNAADIADDDDLVLVMNGITITGKIALTANTINNLVVYQIGPFSPGIPVTDFTVTTIDHGELLVFLG
jgi:hypothetical protein